MTREMRNLTATVAVVLAASGAAAGLARPAEQSGDGRAKSAVVIAGRAANDARAIAEAKRTSDDVRIVHTTAEQLGVTHMLAARGYDVVTIVGVDRRIAIAPVEKKFPHTRFVAAEANLAWAAR